MKLLVVEDETKLRQQLCHELRRHHYSVEEACDGKEALHIGQEYALDMAIVDLGLPSLSGIEVIQQWRAKRLDFPILILTARDNWQDKVEGLEAGADDYLVKPFHVAELIARIKALLRRAHGLSRAELTFGPLHIDLNAKQARLNGQLITLTAYEYNTLEYLALKPQQAISKTELTEHLYEQDYDRDSNVIEVFVGRLRKKIDPSGTLSPIKTLRGQGYMFMLTPDQLT